jgi:multiple sugar transport system substrate-binding protein
MNEKSSQMDDLLNDVRAESDSVALRQASRARSGKPRMTRRTVLAVGIGAASSLAGISAVPSRATVRQAPARQGRFDGVELTVAVGSFMSSGVTMFQEQWQNETGGRINVVQIPFGDLYSKLFSSFTSGVGAYDVAIYASNWIPEFAEGGYILDLEPFYGEKDNWDTVLPAIQRIFGYYRTDALENPDHAAQFQEKYGYELAPPTTWDQYRDIAEFFTGWDWAGSGQDGYGVLEALGPKDVGPFIFTSRAAAYAAHPEQSGTLFFNPDTMTPQIANPGWVRALEDWKAIIPFGPSQMTTYGGGDVRGNFIAGDYALAIDWADIGIQAQDPQSSIVKGKLGYFIAPGSTEVVNPTTNEWDEFPDVSHAPYQGWGGWHASVVASTEHPEAAWDFANFLDTTPNALAAVTTPGTARNPYRTDHFEPEVWTTAPVEYDDPGPYLETQRTALTHPNAQLDLRIPGAGQYFNALDNWVQLALSGQVSSEEALASAAEEWERITDQFGRDSQKEFYVSLIGE